MWALVCVALLNTIIIFIGCFILFMPLDNIRVMVIVWRLRGNINQNSCVLDCVTQCSQSAAHLYEQFLQVQQIGFVTLGPLRCAYRRLPTVVLL